MPTLSVCRVRVVEMPVINIHCIVVACTATAVIKRTPDDVNGMGNFILSGGDCTGDRRK